MIPPPHRRSIRLRGYDYTNKGGYFLTLCTFERACLFGAVVDGTMQPNAIGEIVRDEWFKTAKVRPGVSLDPHEFVVMPNHIHGIIWITDSVRATRRVALSSSLSSDSPRVALPSVSGPPAGSIGAIVGQFKSQVTKRINAHRGAPGTRVWHRNYYEHIIRNGRSLTRIRQYIADNPIRWAFDHENPLATAPDPENPWAPT